MSEHVVVAVKPLSRAKNAALLSIGATRFNPNNLGEVTSRFYVAIDPQTCVDIGMCIDARMFMWWMQPDRAIARDQLIAEVSSQMDIHSALEGFALWYGSEPLPTWGNGISYDNSILENAYTAARMELPWTFREDRCLRTIKTLVPDQKEFFFNTHHNALDDAMYRTQVLQRAVSTLGIKL